MPKLIIKIVLAEKITFNSNTFTMEQNFCCCRPNWFRRHKNQVGPSTPPKLEAIGGVLHVSKKHRTSTTNQSSNVINGETNVLFEGDDHISFSSNKDVKKVDENINGISSIDNENNEEASQGAEESNNPNPSDELYGFLSTIFLQLSKTKQLRVVHIKPKPVQKLGDNIQEQCSLSMDELAESNCSEDDEDYWFTNWSKRPKLKNVWKPPEPPPKDKRFTLYKYEGMNGTVSSFESTITNGNSINHSDSNPSNITSDDSIQEKFPTNQSNEIDEMDATFTNPAFDQESDGELPNLINDYSKLQNENQKTDYLEKEKTNEYLNNLSSSTIINSTEQSEKRVEMLPNPHEKPLLFFIHGISCSSDIWTSQFQFFHNLGFEIVAPDLIGHGMSSTPTKAKHYTLESLLHDLVTIFDYFIDESNRTVVIIGHGYGACMGTVLSRVRSSNIILLIAISGGGPTPLVPFGGIQKPLLPIKFNIFRKPKSLGRFDNPELKHVLPKMIHQHILDGQLWVDGDASFHRKISIPTLLVYGLRDTVVSIVEECEMERTIPKAFLELLPSAGHMVMLDEPLKLNKMILKFIQAWT